MIHAPIALFAYRRTRHLQRTLDALRANAEAPASRLYVFSDGPKSEQEVPAVARVRELLARVEGFASVDVVAREHNLGLARSVIAGVSEVLSRESVVIVLEDDLVVSPHFLGYMNRALQLYALDDQVASIHGYMHPVHHRLPETFFLRGADCWGWATWQRAWERFEPDGERLIGELKRRSLTRAFDLDGTCNFTRMLEDQIAGKNDSWAIRWHASAFLADMVTLHAGRSLVRNIGHDASGTHSGTTAAFDVDPALYCPHVVRQRPVEDAAARAVLVDHFRRMNANRGMPWANRIGRALGRTLFRGVAALPGRRQ